MVEEGEVLLVLMVNKDRCNIIRVRVLLVFNRKVLVFNKEVLVFNSLGSGDWVTDARG
jgi:hypothetical protein